MEQDGISFTITPKKVIKTTFVGMNDLKIIQSHNWHSTVLPIYQYYQRRFIRKKEPVRINIGGKVMINNDFTEFEERLIDFIICMNIVHNKVHLMNKPAYTAEEIKTILKKCHLAAIIYNHEPIIQLFGKNYYMYQHKSVFVNLVRNHFRNRYPAPSGFMIFFDDDECFECHTIQDAWDAYNCVNRRVFMQ
jgi:hypothetical protein